MTIEHLEKLRHRARVLGNDVYSIALDILDDARFPEWSGSSKKHQHHYGRGGLIKHTSEVVDLAFVVKGYYDYRINEKELFLAALFHDVGKIYDYTPYDLDDTNTIWASTEHKRLIHHISRSAIMWSESCKKYATNHPLHDPVLHAILSHHMQRPAGSPVAPKSRVAWLVCLCDNISARMCDADTMDILNIKGN